jgi:hypothetical protein
MRIKGLPFQVAPCWCDGRLITTVQRNGPPCSLAGQEGRHFVLGAPVMMVGIDSVEVERRILTGPSNYVWREALQPGELVER